MPLREMGREQIWLLPPTIGELVPQKTVMPEPAEQLMASLLAQLTRAEKDAPVDRLAPVRPCAAGQG